MKRLTLNSLLFILLAAAPALAGPGIYPPDPALHELRTRAWGLALIHDVALTPKQRTDIKAILTPFRKELDAARTDMDAWRDRWMKPRLEAVIAAYEAGGAPAAPPKEAVEAFRNFKRRRIDAEIQSEAVLKRIENLLTDEQKDRLRLFRPQKVVGFQTGPGGLRRLLKGDPVEAVRAIREAPDEDFDLLVQRMEARLERRMEQPGPRAMMHPERHELRMERMQRAIELMKEIRDLTDEDFEARAEALENEFAATMPMGGGPGGRHGGPMMSPGMGRGMGPGMGPEGGPGRMGRGPGGRHGDRLIREIVFSDAFYNAL